LALHRPEIEIDAARRLQIADERRNRPMVRAARERGTQRK
jgi:hypothetical protein